MSRRPEGGLESPEEPAAKAGSDSTGRTGFLRIKTGSGTDGSQVQCALYTVDPRDMSMSLVCLFHIT
jgi:hypothetical protein